MLLIPVHPMVLAKVPSHSTPISIRSCCQHLSQLPIQRPILPTQLHLPLQIKSNMYVQSISLFLRQFVPKACRLMGAAPQRIDQMDVETVGKCAGGMLALQVTVLLRHLRLQLLRPAIVLPLDLSVPWTTIAAVEVVQAKEGTPILASNAECSLLATRRFGDQL
mmetsp:Transcript_18455/g.27819  ORF Transcript_18455/g.27819 Transcript_18455/m.27819 type:complete len:164 (-) Transcript_18455:43-534(-)